MEEYQRLTGGRRSLIDALGMPGVPDIDFDPPKLDINLRVPDFDD